jgi:hypothetical protein
MQLISAMRVTGAEGYLELVENMVDLSGIEPLASSLRILPPLEDATIQKNRK